MRALLSTFIALILCASVGTAESIKLRRPRLDLRATPRVAFSPVLVTVFAQLQGGDEVEDYYCPELEWDWNDGAKSRHEQDCPPFESGAKLERRFTGEHAYSGPGNYTVKLTLKRAGRVLATANTTVLVNAGVGQGGLQ